MGQRRTGLLSVVVPVYNEADGLHALRAKLTAALANLDFECILVDDGSSDATPDIVRGFAREDPRFKLVGLSRNFGHQAAISAGLAFSNGACVAVMDADLQDPPELLPDMVRLWAEGADVVYGVRTSRQEGLLKRAAYHGFYRLLASVASIELPVDAGDFAVMDRRIVSLIVSMDEHHRYVRGLRSWVGFKQIAFPYDRAARHTGSAKYTLRKLIDLGLAGILSFSYAPLRLTMLAGVAISALAFTAGGFFVLHRLIGFRILGHTPEDVPGIASVFVLIAFMFGIQLLILGVLGEYVGQIFDEVKHRPIFIADELVGLDPTRAPGAPGSTRVAVVGPSGDRQEKIEQ